MKFPHTFLAGAGVLTAGAGGEITGVCTALPAIRAKLATSVQSPKLKNQPIITATLNASTKHHLRRHTYIVTGCPKKQNHEITELCI